MTGIQGPILQVQDLEKSYAVGSWPRKKMLIRALRGVSFDVFEGETLAVVGESGCGKSTLARALMRIETPDRGTLKLLGKDWSEISVRQWQSNIQMIFQDPMSSLNPRKKLFDLIAEPLVIQGGLSPQKISDRVFEVMAQVGLLSDWAYRFPHMLSGGQRQRVGIARALTLNPKILICDEPLSALDVSIQAQVINLFLDLQKKLKISLIFISHDLAVVRHIAHRVLVLYLGEIVEIGPQVARQPVHPYSQSLISSFPTLQSMSPPEKVLQGELPSPAEVLPGCNFEGRCPQRIDRCKLEHPRLRPIADTSVSCHLVS